MSHGWVAMHRSEAIDNLQESYPESFLLLCQIARRARVEACPVLDLDEGEALIGDYKKAGIKSERRYRTAKKRLESCRLVTFKTTSKGTIAKLVDSTVFSHRRETRDEQDAKQATGKRQASDD